MRTINSPDNTPQAECRQCLLQIQRCYHLCVTDFGVARVSGPLDLLFDLHLEIRQLSAFLIKYYLHYFQSTISICESISWDSHCLVRNQVKIDEFRTAPASHPFDANLWDSWLLELEPPNNEPELAASEPSTVRKQLWDKCQTYPNVVSFGWFCIQM